MEMKCYHMMLLSLYKHYVSDENVCAKTQKAIGPHDDLLIIVKRGTPK